MIYGSNVPELHLLWLKCAELAIKAVQARTIKAMKAVQARTIKAVVWYG